MPKIVIIFILGFILSGCSVTKNRGTGTIGPLNGNTLENVDYQNITNNGFFIQKAEVEIITSGGKDRFIATIKFEKPDKYLISIKSRTGIEGARIYITKDTVLVNDRINKKLYSGKASYIRLQYGIGTNLLPLIFGDIILDSRCGKGLIKCVDDKAKINCAVTGSYLNYVIDCKKNKIILSSLGEQEVSLSFDKYFVLNTILVPRNVEFNSSKFKTQINLKIVKVEYPWNGSVSFVPGKGYELIELR